MNLKLMKKKIIPLKAIKLIVYDFDGVLTDNRVLVMEDGCEGVFCNRSDGLAIKKIKEQGILQVILSTESNKTVSMRGVKLGIRVIQNIPDKKKALLKFCKELGLNLKNVVYVGNDLNDLEAMKMVGFPVCPKDADKFIKKISVIILNAKGGYGVARELFSKLTGL